MERGLNLNDPRLKRYLDSLEPKYRKMLEDLYAHQVSADSLEQLKKKLHEGGGDSKQTQEGGDNG